jgi:hypothetical protein
MKYLALAAAGAAVIGLAACSNSGTPAAGLSSTGTAVAKAPVSCSKQYHAWRHGSGKGVLAALDAVSSAESAGNTHVLRVALRKAKPSVTRAASHPVPACADPRGYWGVLLMHVNAAVASRNSATGMQAAMKDVPSINSKLTTELKTTTTTR